MKSLVLRRVTVALALLGLGGALTTSVAGGRPAQPGSPVAVTVATDKAIYRPGEPVRFTLTVTNTGAAPVTVTRSSGQRYDFIVRSADGAEVWRWSRGRFFTQALEEETIGPGRSLTFAETWDQRDNDGRQVPPGAYQVVAVYTTVPPLESAGVSFTIGEPPPPGEETIELFRGCNNVSVTWPPGTPAGTVAAAVTPGAELTAIWRFDNATRTFRAYSPRFPAVSDLTTVDLLDAIFICMDVPGVLTRPALTSRGR